MTNAPQSCCGFLVGERGVLRVLLVSLALMLVLLAWPLPGRAQDDPRTFRQQVQVQAAHWQLLRWSDGFVACNLYVAHAGQPTYEDVRYSCGVRVAQTWVTTPACFPAQYGGSSARCKGLMLRYLGSETRTETKIVQLPKITMRLLVTGGCLPGQWCDSRPGLKLVADEPVEGYEILRVNVRVVNAEKSFMGNSGEIRLPPTDENGEWLEYWAESDFGDQSERFQVRYRAYSSVQAGRQLYRFDLLNDEWAATLPAGALLWQMFPPASTDLPKLFEQPLSAGYLATTNRYALLAGQLIRKGLVDATSCSDRGLLTNGAASACGERAAADAVLAWQNRYDSQIYAAGLKYNVPARVLKGVIAQESQFWPDSPDPYERGLGYVTENGVSMLLLWNLDYYAQACLPIYGRAGCAAGYSAMREDRQIILRRAVFDRIGTDAEIDLLAAMLYASASQTGQLVQNVTRADPTDATTYEDMWKMTVANYYAGSGCLGNALRASLSEKYPLKWEMLASHLEGACVIADDYVHRVIQYAE
jgi:hypothetical protein